MVPLIFERYAPKAVVLQCGVDGLVGDPLGGFNLTLKGLGECLSLVQGLCKGPIPLLVLGGGGYSNLNAARAFTYFTSLLLGRELANNIPEHQFFDEYRDNGFQLHLEPGKESDKNEDSYLKQVLVTILENVSQIKAG